VLQLYWLLLDGVHLAVLARAEVAERLMWPPLVVPPDPAPHGAPCLDEAREAVLPDALLLCNLLADRLARLLDGVLLASGGFERDAFEAGVQTLGLSFCRSSATTTTTTSTTSTTLCAAGLTNCS
jgi:hypothetical protein